MINSHAEYRVVIKKLEKMFETMWDANLTLEETHKEQEVWEQMLTDLKEFNQNVNKIQVVK